MSQRRPSMQQSETLHLLVSSESQAQLEACVGVFRDYVPPTPSSSSEVNKLLVSCAGSSLKKSAE